MSGTATSAVTVYIDNNFGGTGQQLQLGQYNLDYSKVGEDTISSIRVPTAGP